MEPIYLSDVPSTNAVTYSSMVCSHQTLKKETNRCQLIAGGHQLTYGNETAAPGAKLLEDKFIINSTINIFWEKGAHNWADYFIKHFTPCIHKVLCARFVHCTNIILDTIICTSLHNNLSARVC